MKTSTAIIVIILVVLASVSAWYFFVYKKKPEQKNGGMVLTSQSDKEAFRQYLLSIGKSPFDYDLGIVPPELKEGLIKYINDKGIS